MRWKLIIGIVLIIIASVDWCSGLFVSSQLGSAGGLMRRKIVKISSIENLLRNKNLQLKATYFLKATEFRRFVKGQLTHLITFNQEPVDGAFLISCEPVDGTVRTCLANTSEYSDVLSKFELKSGEFI